MTTPSFERTSWRRPGRNRTRAVRIVLVVLAAAVVFGLGAALGAALESNPRPPGGSHTYVRTFAPLPTASEPETVTVTSSGP